MFLWFRSQLFKIVLTVLLFGSAVEPSYAQQTEIAQKPEWAKGLKPPLSIGKKCFIGTSQGSSDRNKELNDAYKNALINVIEREFPELISIRTESSERLEGSTYSRDTAYKSEMVEYKGLTEDKESPFLEEKAESKKVIAYRLLCWSLTDLEAEKIRQKEIKRQLSTAVSNTSDSLIPPHANPGPTGELEIITVPASATILLAAEPLGKSNARFSKVVAGTYDLVIEKDGYEIQSRKVTINAGQKTTEKIELKKLTSKLTVSTQPSGATVYINNKPLDIHAPVEYPVVVGDDIEIRVELDDYEVESRKIKATHRPKTESFSLTPKMATLSVISSPAGADVKLNGSSLGKTPIRSKKVNGGRYDLSIELDGYETHREMIEVWRSRPATPIANLRPSADLSKSKNIESGNTSNNPWRTVDVPAQAPDKSMSGSMQKNSNGPDMTPLYRFTKKTLALSSAYLTGATLWYLFYKPTVDPDATSVQRQAQFPPGKEICEYYGRACDRYLMAAGIGAVGSVATLYASINMETELFGNDNAAAGQFTLGLLSFVVNGWVLSGLYENIQAGKAAKAKYDQATTSQDAERFRSYVKEHSDSVDTYFPLGAGLTLLGLYWSF